MGRDRNELSRMLQAICEQLEQDLRHKGYRAQTIGIKLRFDDFSILTRDITVDAPVVAAAELIHYARQNLRRTQIRHRKLRLIGVRAAKLMAEADCEAMGSQPVQLALGDFL